VVGSVVAVEDPAFGDLGIVLIVLAVLALIAVAVSVWRDRRR